ncbi:hypothetical protein V6N13_120841 [Hibiscus sabdariffa]
MLPKTPLRLSVALFCAAVSLFAIAGAEDPYKFFSWNITYGDIYPLGVRQTGILINGQFPGPDIHSVTNDNLIINVFNNLNESFLLSWGDLCFNNGKDSFSSFYKFNMVGSPSVLEVVNVSGGIMGFVEADKANGALFDYSMMWVLQAQLDGGKKLPFPDGILINGRGPGGASLNVEQGMNSPSPRMLSSVVGQSAEAPDPCKPPHHKEVMVVRG